MTADRLKKKVARRKDRFQPDPLLKAMNVLAVVPKEYQGSKYDKGHLAPAADFAWDQEANNETFYMSNMVPQSPSLNRSAWKILEEKVRRFACGEGRVTVITGPILKKNMKMTDTGIPIPEQFFKIVFDETPPLKVIAYIYNQTDKGNVTEQRVVPLREVESKVNEKFAPESPEGPLRQPSQINLWKEEAC